MISRNNVEWRVASDQMSGRAAWVKRGVPEVAKKILRWLGDVPGRQLGA
jgi:hypothetical protein